MDGSLYFTVVLLQQSIVRFMTVIILFDAGKMGTSLCKMVESGMWHTGHCICTFSSMFLLNIIVGLYLICFSLHNSWVYWMKEMCSFLSWLRFYILIGGWVQFD